MHRILATYGRASSLFRKYLGVPRAACGAKPPFVEYVIYVVYGTKQRRPIVRHVIGGALHISRKRRERTSKGRRGIVAILDRQSETEQPDHSASLGDSITSSTRTRFSVHTRSRVRAEVRERRPRFDEVNDEDVPRRLWARSATTALRMCSIDLLRGRHGQ